jgi:hypothetical protein
MVSQSKKHPFSWVNQSQIFSSMFQFRFHSHRHRLRHWQHLHSAFFQTFQF